MKLRWKIAQFFELLWWRRYLATRHKTEYLAWKRQYWHHLLQKSEIRITPESKVLDAGCGPAGIFTILRAQTVDAVDPLLDAYERRLAHFRKKDFPGVTFYAQSLETFVSRAPYDVVFCLNALNHVADLSLCLRQLHTLTAEGGTLALSIDAHNFSLLRSIFRSIPADILHPHQYDLSGYRQMLEAHGFVAERSILLDKGLIFNYYLIEFSKPHTQGQVSP
jgi:2-polyprenyl-3-methyl-5-hydroxy-6-metoxy-1,4-benzoquinol methylase